MKRIFGSALILALVSVPALAASNSQSVTFPDTVKVAGSQLSAGEYKVSWTGNDANAQVTISKKGMTPVTLQAKVVDQKHDHNGVTTNAEGGANVLQVIQLSRVSLVIEGAQVAGQ
jgi:hypothetical protein